MGRVNRIVREPGGKHPYYVEVSKDGGINWAEEVRYYALLQDPADYPDSNEIRGFKYLGKEKNEDND